MIRLRLAGACLIAWLATTTTACSGTPVTEAPGGPFAVALAVDGATQRPIIRVTGWSAAELRALRNAATLDSVVRVAVASSPDIAIASAVRATPDALEVVPRFPLDPGRAYIVRVDASTSAAPRPGPPTEVTVTVPASTAASTTRVTAIYPTSSVWPANLLRFYLHFSAPMSGTSAVGHVRLVDDRGAEIHDALLDVDVDLWNAEYTRRTVFFDPGRVKRDIRPNREMGRALVPGRKYAIVVGTSWRDAQGQPLAGEFRHAFTAGPAIEAPLEPASWAIKAPAGGTRDPLIVRFPWALDEGLLHRALGVTGEDGQPLAGVATVGSDQSSWTFTPASPWRDAAHAIVVLTLLEDPSGNKVGQAFEFEMLKDTKAEPPERLRLPFRPGR